MPCQDWLPKTSADLAAWMQFFGTILAIGAAIAIASREHRQSERRIRQELADRRLREISIAAHALALADQDIESLSKMEDVQALSSESDDFEAVLARLTELRGLVHPSAMTALGASELRSLLSATEAIAEIIWFLIHGRTHVGMVRYYVVEAAKKALPRVHSAAEEFSRLASTL